MRVWCAVLLLLGGLQLSWAQLLIGAFNVQVFGEKKSQDVTVMEHITTIVRRYDVIVIQEVRESSSDTPVIDSLMSYVNKQSSDYDFRYSSPLGDSNQKERYLCLFRKNKVTFGGSYQYPDTNNKFSRPPFVVNFLSKMDGEVLSFSLVPLHSKPSEAVREIDALVEVEEEVASLPDWNDNILMLGDFNAGCRYVTGPGWKNIRLRTQTDRYRWLIDDDAVTNLSDTPCPYDRIVATTVMNRRVVRGSARVYNFQHALGLTLEEAREVSDHFPVEVQLN